MTDLTHSDLQRSLGRVEGRLTALEGAMVAGFRDLKDMIREAVHDGDTDQILVVGRLDAIEKREERRKGAWGVIVTMAGMAGGVFAWIAGRIFGG
jgi:hypothetical protein